METVRDSVTGLFFDEQTPEALIEALERFERDLWQFLPESCRAQAASFDAARFRAEMRDFVAAVAQSALVD